MCDLCSVFLNESKPVSDGDYCAIYMWRTEFDEWYIIAKADGNAYLKIEYCPHCGRKLGGDLDV